MHYDDKDNDRTAEIDFDCGKASFPSDNLSVGRLRKLFPGNFDLPGRIADGYASSDFFFPIAAERPSHLMRLTELICDERTVAAGAFMECHVARFPEVLNEEDRDAIAESQRRLEDAYQLFKLADSPEVARLLVRQVKEEGTRQASRGRSAR